MTSTARVAPSLSLPPLRSLLFSLPLSIVISTWSGGAEQSAYATPPSASQPSGQPEASPLRSKPHKGKEIWSRRGDTREQALERAKKKRKDKDQSHIPLPTNKKRGFWGTFFFWFGGVLCMYFVGRHVFKEQSHQRRTLRRLRDELGHFFPEFDPVNITKWVTIAADHVFYAWREGDTETLKSFSTPKLIEAQEAQLRDQQSSAEQRTVHLNKILGVHTLGMEWKTRDAVEHPPLGVKLTLRVELSAIDFTESSDGTLLKGKRKPQQFQWIWILIHNGKSWTLDEVKPSQGDLTNLNQAAPLPELASWRRPSEESLS